MRNPVIAPAAAPITTAAPAAVLSIFSKPPPLLLASAATPTAVSVPAPRPSPIKVDLPVDFFISCGQAGERKEYVVFECHDTTELIRCTERCADRRARAIYKESGSFF